MKARETKKPTKSKSPSRSAASSTDKPRTKKTPSAAERAKVPAARPLAVIAGVKERAATLTKAQKTRLTELVAIIREAKKTISKSVLVMARALKEVRDQALWRADTRDGFEAWCDLSDLVSAGYARKLIDIVEALPDAKALPFGVDKMWQITRYAIDADRDGGVKAMLTKGATINDRPVDDLDEDEIHDARMKLAVNVEKSKKRDPERRKQQALAEKAEKALSKRTGTKFTVTVKRDGEGWAFTIVTSAAGAEALLARM
jgi:hypothetical protein